LLLCNGRKLARRGGGKPPAIVDTISELRCPDTRSTDIAARVLPLAKAKIVGSSTVQTRPVTPPAA
jgi:hypothetical protein